MKQRTFLTRMGIFPSVILLLSACAGVVTQPDWKFVNSVGGVSVDSLEMIDGLYYLPVKMSVASYKPGTKSELVCTSTSTRVAGNMIWLYVKTDSRKNAPRASAECPKAKVGGIPDGKYRVLFVDETTGEKYPIGEVVADLANVGNL